MCRQNLPPFALAYTPGTYRSHTGPAGSYVWRSGVKPRRAFGRMSACCPRSAGLECKHTRIAGRSARGRNACQLGLLHTTRGAAVKVPRTPVCSRREFLVRSSGLAAILGASGIASAEPPETSKIRLYHALAIPPICRCAWSISKVIGRRLEMGVLPGKRWVYASLLGVRGEFARGPLPSTDRLANVRR
jgi:hypothetical protein